MNNAGPEAQNIISIPIRHYQIAQLYGPGMPPTCKEGFQDKVLSKPAGQVGLVSVHCWNLGEPDGPYPLDDAEHYPGEVADWVPSAHHIINNKIKPVLDAARSVGMPVFHLAQPTYATKYPQYQEIMADPDLRPRIEEAPFAGCVRPRSFETHMLAQYGSEFPGPVWETHAQLFDIAQAVKPLPEEPVIVDGWQLNGLCRRLDIDTLIYVGFMADLCLINIPGAIREMFTKFGYYCLALRDCTIAYEYADTYDGTWMTLAAIRMIETDLGDSATSDDFIRAANHLLAQQGG